MIVFDIETGPQSDEDIASRVKPFEPPAAPGEFDPEAVKYGRTKDPEKRAAILKDKQEAHAKLVKNHEIEACGLVGRCQGEGCLVRRDWIRDGDRLLLHRRRQFRCRHRQ